MKVSRRGLYALQALIHLAEAYETGLVAAHTVAEKEGIPEKFLEGILLALKNARVISSERGRDGGYRLRKPPGEIFIGDVVELQHRVKTEVRHPGLFDVFLEVRNAAAAIVDRTSLADLVERNRRVLAERVVAEPRR